MKKIMIFDFDGTLGDSELLITNTMLETIEKMGLPQRSRRECAAPIGLPLAECFSSIIPMTDEKAEECADVYSEIFHRNNIPGAVPPFPNVIETLRTLHEKGTILTLASSRHHHSLAAFVDEMQLNDCISYMLGANDVTFPKPNGEPVTKTLERFSIAPADALVIGDTKFDILMGRNAGVETCGVTYGNGTKEELIAAGADCLIDGIQELLHLPHP